MTVTQLTFWGRDAEGQEGPATIAYKKDTHCDCPGLSLVHAAPSPKKKLLHSRTSGSQQGTGWSRPPAG